VFVIKVTTDNARF